MINSHTNARLVKLGVTLTGKDPLLPTHPCAWCEVVQENRAWVMPLLATANNNCPGQNQDSSLTSCPLSSKHSRNLLDCHLSPADVFSRHPTN